MIRYSAEEAPEQPGDGFPSGGIGGINELVSDCVDCMLGYPLPVTVEALHVTHEQIHTICDAIDPGKGI